jgi:muramoyltetrapeptide carboxypeptidase
MNTRRNFIKKSALLTAGALINPAKAASSQLIFEEKTIKPPALKKGDTVAITSPAGAVWDDKQIETFSNILKGFGFKVVLGKTLYEKFGYFSGTDDFRAKELNGFFSDKNVKAIFCMKGGWGCARILDKLNYELMKNNPKILIGFSDITALLVAITAKTGLVTFHGPVGNSGWNEYTKNVFSEVCMEGSTYSFPENPFGEEKIITINKGIASGQLFGGNLTVLSGIMGSNYLPDFKNKILFLEEAKEEPYSIDRMLTQLKLCGVLNNISGFVFGKCAKCLAEEPLKAFTFDEVIKQHIEPLGIPAFYGAMIGHIENKYTIPLGVNAIINADTGSIKLLEEAVK